MNFLTGLFRAARKRTQTTDNDMGQFRTKIEELVASKDSLSDEDVVKKVEELKGYTADLPGEGKAKVDRFLEDFKNLKEIDAAAAKEAADMVSDLFEKLDTEAMQDVPAVETEQITEEEEPAETPEPAPEETVSTEEIAEETEIPAEPAEGEKEAEDAEGPLDEYTAEELYQFAKKRLMEEFDLVPKTAAEDGCADSAEEVEEEKEEEEEVVADHAPRLSVTMNGTTAAKTGGLSDLFNTIKGGR